MHCPRCTRALNAPAARCPGCSSALELVCDGCGRRSPTDHDFCAGCGNRLTTLALAEPAATASDATGAGRVTGGTADPSELPGPMADQLEGQRRIVTIMMSDLSGYTAMGEQLDPEDIAEIMRTIKEDGTRIVEAFGGIVNQFIGDEITSLFGLPSMRDDDPQRAVSAALALHARVEELNQHLRHPISVPLTMHSGINTGLLIAELRDQRNGVYELTGDAINTASRLLGVAGRGEVVIGEPTRVAVESFFEIEDAGAHTVRGKAEPLPAFRVLRRRDHVTAFDAARDRGLTPLAGRDEELRRLASEFAAASAGAGRLIVIDAEAGTGKSRLCFEFVERVRRHSPDIAVIKGRCQSYGAMTSYLPFIEVVRETLGIEVGAPADGIAATVPRALGRIDPELERFAPAYLHLLGAVSVEDLPDDWQGEGLPEILQGAIVALLVASGRHAPIVIQLDDWHWADEASEATFVRLRRALPEIRALLIVTQRPGAPTSIADATTTQWLPLGPLGRSAADGMIAGFFGVASVEPGLADTIHERTQGNPFFVEEVCRALQTRGEADVVAGRVVLADDAADLVIPDTVQAVVLGRVDLLQPELRELLRIASVVGREFRSDVLAALTEPGSLADRLERLIELGFIEAMPGTDGTRRFRFRHMITQEVTYDTLLVRERRSAHGRIATVIEESQTPTDVQQRRHVEALAYHFHRAGMSAKALDYFDQAGAKAESRRALAEARQQIRAAIDETRHLDQTPELRARRGKLALRWAQACIFLPSMTQIELLESVQQESLEDGDLEVALLANYWINWIQYSIGNQLASEAGTRFLLGQVEAVGLDDTAALLKCHLGQVLVIQRRHDEAEGLIADGLRGREENVEQLAASDPGLGLYCYSLSQQSLIDADRGATRPESRGVDAALRICVGAGDRSTEASLLIVSAIARILDGDFVSARDDVDAISVLPDASVSPFVRIMAMALHGYAEFRIGATPEALRALEAGVTAHEHSEAHLALCLTRSLLADALVRAERFADAVVQARAALARAEVGDRIGEHIAEAALARAEAELADARPR